MAERIEMKKLNKKSVSKARFFKVWMLLAFTFIVSACTEQVPNNTQKQEAEKSLAWINFQNNIQNRVVGAEGFSVFLYPLLVENCSQCHNEVGSVSPMFAHEDASVAQTEVVSNQKISFSNTANSRIVVKVRDEFHYCWSECEANALSLQTAINQWLDDSIGKGNTTPSAYIINSTTQTLADGVLDAGIQRYDDQVIAFYEFKEGSGNVANDTSGVTPALNLTLDGPVWAAGQGIEIQTGIAIGTAVDSKKLFDQIVGGPTATQEFSIEAWVIPANVTQEGPARIVTYSDGTQNRNFTMGQQTYDYAFRNRNDSPDISTNGTPALQTINAEQVLQASQQHVVMTYSAIEGRKIYVNGLLKISETNNAATLNNWDSNFTFAIGNETTNNRLFMGVVQLVAIHKRALSLDQVTQNFEAGVGVKFTLRFDVSQTLGQPGNYIQFEVSEFDRYSYLFNKPVFISAAPNGFRVKNVEVAVNGQIPVAGQTWRNIDTTITQNEQPLFDMAAVIRKDLGPEADQFSIFFEILGDKENIIIELSPFDILPQEVLDVAPRTGVRTFEQITNAMATVTGVDVNTGSVKQTYLELKQQLPSLPSLNGFLASHQVGISKLALEYCDVLVDSPVLRDQFFGVNSFDFNAPVSTALANTVQVDQMVQRLMDKIIGINLSNQPDTMMMRQELNNLITDLSVSCSSPSVCDAVRTRSIVKASCAAVLGSAAFTLK